MLGSFDPKSDAKAINGERIRHWISKGVQLSETLHNLLISEKIIEGKKINVLPKKSPVKKRDENAAPTAVAPVTPTPVEENPAERAEEKIEEKAAESETPAAL